MEAERESLINNLEICHKKEGFLSYMAELKESLCENQELTLEEKRNILSNVIESIHVRTLDKQQHELTVNFHLAYATDSNYEKVLENSFLKTSSAWRSHCDTHGTGDTSDASQTLTSGNYSKCISSPWNKDVFTKTA
ncbi:hypothetical protein [Desulfomicrobium apsheronum]|uniref:hypothetical protein n=1 Tax=Desulfomicrobium apsheronum TaxID=52560 RepID=UPI0015A5EA52|nr:hypothetical protein [Desulfomicrobium apsheronum]